MSKSKGILDSISKGVILLFLGLAALLLGSIFLFVFVPIVVAYVWDNRNRTKAVEARLAKLEKPSEETGQPQA